MNRPNNIYQPEQTSQRLNEKKQEVCIQFLAGKCGFEKGCRRRHPPKTEIPRILSRYKKTRCRFRDECHTKGCLFLHPEEEQQQEPSSMAPHNFPPLSVVCKTASSPSSSESGNVSGSAWDNHSPTLISEPPSSPEREEDHNVSTNEKPSTKKSSPRPQQSMPQFPTPQQGSYNCSMPQNVPTIMESHGIDPNTGYPMDPSVYYSTQHVFYSHQQQYTTPLNPIFASGEQTVPHIRTHFNAEAKEFIPGMFKA